MPLIQGKEDWEKVRKLYKQNWIIPSWVYLIGVAICTVAIFFGDWTIEASSFIRANALWLTVGACCLFRLAREDNLQGYIDGWSDGEDYVVGHTTIDELLDLGEKSKNKTKGKI